MPRTATETFHESDKLASSRRSLKRARYEFMLNYGEHTNLPLDIAEQNSFQDERTDSYGGNLYDDANIFTSDIQPNALAKGLNTWRRLKSVFSKDMNETLSPLRLPGSEIFRDNSRIASQSATKQETSVQDEDNILNKSSDELFLDIFGERKQKGAGERNKVATPNLVISPRREFADNESQDNVYRDHSITILDTENCRSSDDLFPKNLFEPFSVCFSEQGKRQMRCKETQYHNERIGRYVNHKEPIETYGDHATEEPEQKKQRSVSCQNPAIEDSQQKKQNATSCQADKWLRRYDELVDFQKKHKHSLVPHDFSENIELARWVKRQRYQYNLFQRHEKSSITYERMKLLEKIGFVWGAQEANWEERFKELVEYKKIHGHCDVHTKSSSVPKLGTWVRCQRRQYHLFMLGKRSNMTRERIETLEKLGLRWKIRSSRSA
mmetsp:Transcript_22015/g.32518  ORF Transcript_22015/g.32518 Transcript_22015/m.32518 type:complete len:438 (-) Transcript_22015:60-1373(-)